MTRNSLEDWELVEGREFEAAHTARARAQSHVCSEIGIYLEG